METPILVTRSFDMMPLRQKDAGVMFSRWMTDKLVAKYTPWQPHKDAAETEEFVKTDITRNEGDDYFSWGMFFDDFSHGANRPRIFGFISLSIDKDLPLGTIEFNLMRSEWGKGYAVEAIYSVLCFAFERLKLQNVIAACHVGNKPAARVLDKLGFYRQYEFQSLWKTGKKVSLIRYQMSYNQFFNEDDSTTEE